MAGNAGPRAAVAKNVPEGQVSINLLPELFKDLEGSNDTSILFGVYQSSALFPVSNGTRFRLANITDSQLVSHFDVASTLVSTTMIGQNVTSLPNNTKVTIVLKLQSNVSSTPLHEILQTIIKHFRHLKFLCVSTGMKVHWVSL